METIVIKEEYKRRCINFANEIIKRNDQFSRLLPEGVHKDSELGKTIAIQRTLVGKYGEVALLQLLMGKGLISEIEAEDILNEMFDIYKGQSNVDFYDFKTKSGEKVDVKTAYLYFHQNLLVNRQQFEVPEDKKKDLYVGVKVKTYSEKVNYTYEKDGITKYGTVNIVRDIEFVKNVEIYGYVTREELDKLIYTNTNKHTGKVYVSPWDYSRGEGPCKSILLDKLTDIDSLLDKFKQNNKFRTIITMDGRINNTYAGDVYFWNSLGCDYNLVFCQVSGRLIGYEVSKDARIEEFEEYEFSPDALGLPNSFREYCYSEGSLEYNKNHSYESLRLNYWK